MRDIVVDLITDYLHKVKIPNKTTLGIIADIEEQVSIDTLQLFLKVEKVKKKTQ